jgi:hypothetical protein
LSGDQGNFNSSSLMKQNRRNAGEIGIALAFELHETGQNYRDLGEQTEAVC